MERRKKHVKKTFRLRGGKFFRKVQASPTEDDMTYTAAKHPSAPRLWIVAIAATGERVMRHHHWQTRREAQDMASHLNAINAPTA